MLLARIHAQCLGLYEHMFMTNADRLSAGVMYRCVNTDQGLEALTAIYAC